MYHMHPHGLLAKSPGWKANPARSDFFHQQELGGREDRRESESERSMRSEHAEEHNTHTRAPATGFLINKGINDFNKSE